MTLRFTHADRATVTGYRIDWTLAAGGSVIFSQPHAPHVPNVVPDTDPQQYTLPCARPDGQPLGQSYRVTLTAIRNGQETTSAPSAAFQIDAPLSAPSDLVVLDPLV